MISSMASYWPSARRAYPALACLLCFLLLSYFFLRSPDLDLQEAPPVDYEADLSGSRISGHGHESVPADTALEAIPSPPFHTPSAHQGLDPGHETPKCRLTKVSMLYGAHKFAQLEMALESHRQHSDRWGCGFESLGENISDRRLFSKQYFLLAVMLREMTKPVDQRQKWLMWVDADSILINPAISPEVFLPPEHMEDVYALVTGDHNGLNAGIFYLKVHSKSVDLLTQTVDYPVSHPDVDLGWFGEQAAMANVIKILEASPEYRSTKHPGIAWVPREWFNTYQLESGFEGKPGDLLVHFAGLGETRLMHMANWLDELQQHQAKWEIPLEQTPYKTAIPQFWNEYGANTTASS